MSSIKSVYLCGVHVSNHSCREIEQAISGFLQGTESRHVVTVNPEFLYRSAHDPVFREVLNTADLQVIDGFGVTCAFLWHGQRAQCRMTGVELMWQLLDHADRKNLSVFLATNAFGLTLWQDMQDVIQLRYPHIRMSGANIDPQKPHIDADTKADIVLCNFGAPYQELFLHELKKRHACKVGIGVGGAFDFASGRVVRAPKWMRMCGCEWLWRLIRQPKRWRRIMRAVIIFPLYVVLGK